MLIQLGPLQCLGNISSRYASRRILLSASHPRFFSNKKQIPDEPRDKWNYNKSPFDESLEADHTSLKLVTANLLERSTKPPTGVKMLVRDFIEDSLYNPNYGYFPKQATIFNAKEAAFDFNSMRDSAEFQEIVGEKYSAYGQDSHEGPGRQLWHTPTELFKVTLCIWSGCLFNF